MAKPQQPELRRSGTVPALDPDAAESDLQAHRRPGDSGTGGPIPEDQRPGHHPEQEQDKPDLDKFAERLGIVAEGEEPPDAPRVEDEVASNVTRLETAPSAPARPKPAARRTAPPAGAPQRPTWSPIGLALVGPVTGILIARDLARRLARLRR